MPTRISTIHTLGPSGTNCEAAARRWFDLHDVKGGDVKLYTTLEEAAASLPAQQSHALLGCAVYPNLHLLVFENLGKFQLVDSFVNPTFDMVLAARTPCEPIDILSHPAPSSLAPVGARISLATSNAAAARRVANGEFDACITTAKSAAECGLVILRNHGPVPMVFTIHQPLGAATTLVDAEPVTERQACVP